MKQRFSASLATILSKASAEAGRNRNLNPSDVLVLAMLNEPDCHAQHILRRLLRDWEIFQIKIRIEHLCSSADYTSDMSNEQIFAEITNSLERICRAMNPSASETVVNTGHLLLYALRGDGSDSWRVLSRYGLSLDIVSGYVADLPPDENYYSDLSALKAFGSGERTPRPFGLDLVTKPERQHETPLLDKFGTDLTAAASAGKIDPVVGRETETERLVQILSRRRKNNPVLVGEAGVGKSAVVEGLALRMAAGRVPSSLSGKRLFALDISSLVAGTKYRGDFEQRLNSLLEELEGGNIVLFIDEIHTIVGAGASNGALDAANILKPALTRGHMQCVGATTLDEYRRHIESDAALERRFQKIMVEPATAEQTLDILLELAPIYGIHHGVCFGREALEECVALTERYMADRNFPDKAIDIMDEAGSRVRSAAMSLCTATDGRDTAVAERVEVTADHVREVVAAITGIPLQRLGEDQKTKLSLLSRNLAAKVIGQGDAVERISKAVLRARSGLKEPSKPIGVFLFVGPTGVGKTLLAKELSRQMFDSERNLLRFDMSEYGEPHNVSRLIGSPPGYVGYGEGGRLTEAVRHAPYSVVLFDEIEKAHPDVFNLMLQIFDDGALTDGSGRRVDFRNTIIILTSNAGSKKANSKRRALGYANSVERTEADREDAYRTALESLFAPEFLNRLDDIIFFNPLSAEDAERIVELEIEALTARAAAAGCKLKISRQARRNIARRGYSDTYGARNLKRAIKELVEEPLAELMVSGPTGGAQAVEFVLSEGRVVPLDKSA